MGRLEEGGVGPETVQGQERGWKIRASTWEGQEVNLLRDHLLRGPTFIATFPHRGASLPVSLLFFRLVSLCCFTLRCAHAFGGNLAVVLPNLKSDNHAPVFQCDGSRCARAHKRVEH